MDFGTSVVGVCSVVPDLGSDRAGMHEVVMVAENNCVGNRNIMVDPGNDYAAVWDIRIRAYHKFCLGKTVRNR